ARSVVIPGSYTKTFTAGAYQVPCALIIGKRKASTDKKTSLNDALREHNVAVQRVTSVGNKHEYPRRPNGHQPGARNLTERRAYTLPYRYHLGHWLRCDKSIGRRPCVSTQGPRPRKKPDYLAR